MGTYLGADGTSLHHDDLGDEDAPAVVVLAGGPARHPGYLGDLAGLGAHHRLVLPHLRGVGRSPAPREPDRGSFWRQAEDVAALRAALGERGGVVVGHSAGARLAVSHAVRFPGLVTALVLIAPATMHLVPEPPGVPEEIERRRADPVFDEAWRTLLAGPDGADEDAYDAWQRAVAPAGYASWGPREQEHTRTGGWHLAAARAYFSVSAPEDLATRVAALAVPTLVVAGDRDAFLPLAAAREFAGLFARGRLVVVEDAGHYPWLEQPEAFRAAVDPFLREVTG